MITLKPGNKYLFDTTVYIDLLRKRTMGQSLHYQARFSGVSVGYSVITEAELWAGITNFWTEEQHITILRLYKRYFINVTIARDAGKFWRQFTHVEKLKGSDLPGLADCLIAATARYYGLRLVTKNTRHGVRFIQFGVELDGYADND